MVALSAPMLLAIVSMMGFNLVDTFFVAKLGTLPLAALTLTFPVGMVVATFTLGLGVGAMAIISQSIGAKDQSSIRRYSTDALSLTLLCGLAITLVGMATIEPLFAVLGATQEMMPYIKQYMYIFYPGMAFYIVPMIGNNIMRATGDTLTPSLLMIGGMALNAALDPVFIFGVGPVGGYGIAGAAIASVLSRGIMLVASLYVLYFRQKMLTKLWPGFSEAVTSWKAILSIGLPVAISNAVIPVALGILTRLVIKFGPQQVAGFCVASRIEGLGFTFMIALSTGLSPFIGQNFGAKQFDRIHRGLALSKGFSLGVGIVLFFLFFLFGQNASELFTKSTLVAASSALYLAVVGVSLGLRGVHQIIWTSLNVIGRPYDSLGLELFLAFILWIPFAFFGSMFAGITGLYAGIALGNCIAGAVAIFWGDRVISVLQKKQITS